MVFYVMLVVLAAVAGGLYGLGRVFDRLLDAREHGTPQEELRHSEMVAGSVIQSGSGGFNGR